VRRAELDGRRVAIWGIGGEGRAAASAARSAGAADVVALVDPPLGDPASGLDAWKAAGLADVPVLPAGRGMPAVDVLVLSPGVSRYRPEVQAAEADGAVVTNGTELYLAEQGARTIAVTGSKGKSTVTRLTAHLLAATGRPAVAAGNIGRALLDLLPELPSAPLVVAEVSSYQAALVQSPPRVAVLTSLFPDHLPWHGSVERYYADKLRLFAAQHQSGFDGDRVALVNGGDAGVAALLGEPALAGATEYGVPVARVRVVAADAARDGPLVLVGDQPVLSLRRSRLRGAHNAVNVAAAIAVLDALGVDVPGVATDLEQALATFAPLPHRLEPVATVAGVTFVDDSLATSTHAAVAACEAYPDRPLTLLVGGLDRGIDYQPLVAYLRQRADVTPITVVAMGPAGRRVALDVRGVPVEVTDGISDAVRIAAKVTTSGGVVLFSPAAPSPPEYGTYERRSAAFVAAVRDLKGGPRWPGRPNP
jgi:UDP-N-acetylmuramoyl-L-alanine---L-glutamate ligase